MAMSGSEVVVEARELRKSYGRVEALRGVSFEVSAGEVYGLIGPDGSGKTSLFRILTSLCLPTSGTATVLGCDVKRDYRRLRRLFGYMPGRFALYQDLTVEENLSFFATVFGTTIEENYSLIADIYRQIEPFKRRRAAALSGGMKQKLALCCSLVHAPRVLFLDEPTTGVDPVSRREFWEMLGRLRERGITILVSTPYMDEAVLCDRIALIAEGQFLTIDTPRNICHSFSKPLYAVSGGQKQHLLDDIRQAPGVESAFSFGETIHATLQNDNPGEVAQFLSQRGHNDVILEPIEADVEDCFMHLSANHG